MENHLEFLQRCVRDRKIYWTYHVNMRLERRFLPREIIVESWSSFEIIEEYPTDKYLPSYLVYAENQGLIFHLVLDPQTWRGTMCVLSQRINHR